MRRRESSRDRLPFQPRLHGDASCSVFKQHFWKTFEGLQTLEHCRLIENRLRGTMNNRDLRCKSDASVFCNEKQYGFARMRRVSYMNDRVPITRESRQILKPIRVVDCV